MSTDVNTAEDVVRKQTMDCYRIRAKGEWATICVTEWRSSQYYGGEILIHSSFGSWANSWSACANRFKSFLCGCDFDYVFTKFMGHELRKHDGEASLKQLHRSLIERRKHGGLDRDDARELWDALEDNRSELEDRDIHSWVETLSRISQDSDSREIRSFLEEPWTLATTSYDCSATGFWRDLWPAFRSSLLAEVREVAA